MIEQLRRDEHILLYSHVIGISYEESRQVIDFLENEYKRESLNYPYEAPAFDPEAALWAARLLYHAAQLLLFREHHADDLGSLITDYPGQSDASSMLSCDLCLRFLPGLITQLKLIDNDDALIPMLERQLQRWHYSGISHPLQLDELDMDILSSDKCLQQLYANRVIENRKINLAKHPSCMEIVRGNLGIFAHTLWHQFDIETQHEQH